MIKFSIKKSNFKYLKTTEYESCYNLAGCKHLLLQITPMAHDATMSPQCCNTTIL
jgi:hypothetical protein